MSNATASLCAHVSRSLPAYRDMGDGPVALLVMLPHTNKRAESRHTHGLALTTNNGRMNAALADTSPAHGRGKSIWSRLFRRLAARSRAYSNAPTNESGA